MSHHNLRSVGAIDSNRANQHLQHHWIELFRIWDLVEVLVTSISLHHSHSVGGQGASLIRADGSGIAHGLTCIQVTNQVVILHHFLMTGRNTEREAHV